MFSRFGILPVCCFFILFIDKLAYAETSLHNQRQIIQYLQALTQHPSMGARLAGSEKETNTATYIRHELQKMGYQVQWQPFSYHQNGEIQHSVNLIAELSGHSDKVMLLGAHYDSIGGEFGSQGAIDNGSGIAAILVIAKNIAQFKPAFTIRFIAFGAEEVGLKGSGFYVKTLSQLQRQKIIGMVNFDTIAGGDHLYIHSADTRTYGCDLEQYASSPIIRDVLLKLSQQIFAQGKSHRLSPATQAFAKGVTGNWSDHAPFACIGVPIAYIEATNFEIDGKGGRDGYSQTTDPRLWSCFDPLVVSSCKRKQEKHWGQIWHTQHDRLDKLQSLFPDRLSSQINRSVILMTRFFTDMPSHLN